MWIKKLMCLSVECMVLCCALLIGMFAVPVGATEIGNTPQKNLVADEASPLATGSFSMRVPSQTKVAADGSFSLAAGETVTIKASYSPFSASVDFGLIAPNGTFYYFNITNGSINKAIQVSESGNYVFQVRNNSDVEVIISGFVNY